jgi:hypothetical protein
LLERGDEASDGSDLQEQQQFVVRAHGTRRELGCAPVFCKSG